METDPKLILIRNRTIRANRNRVRIQVFEIDFLIDQFFFNPGVLNKMAHTPVKGQDA